jgi:hypothetical protein
MLPAMTCLPTSKDITIASGFIGVLAGDSRLVPATRFETDRFVNLIHNERVKLTTLWLNTLSGASIAAAVIAPLRFYGVPSEPIAPGLLYLGVGLWFFAGIVLHFTARWLLGSLKE